MPNIALVEDEPEAADVLASFIARYAGEKGLELTVTRFGNAMDFEMTHQHFDLVFMDIQMPGINGMEAAQLMRTYDSETPIIFVTNLAQYAVKGYEVDALDFIVKPVTYFNFRMRMDKAMRKLEAMLLCADRENLLLVSGTGEVIEPDDGVLAIVSGGNYALAAARALIGNTELPAQDIARKALEIASEICVFTNSNIIVETV